MKHRIVGLSMEFSDLNFKNIDTIYFKSKISTLSYDILIINLSGVAQEYSFEKEIGSLFPKYHNGVPLLDDVDSYTLISDINRRKAEVTEFLESGKTVIIIPPKENTFAVCTNSYHLIKLLSIVPIDNLVFSTGSGNDLDFLTADDYEKLFSVNDLKFEYHYSIDSRVKNSKDLAVIPNSKKIVAKDFIFGSAHLLILPIALDRYSYKSDKQFRSVVNAFLKELDIFHEDQKYSIESFELPAWTQNYAILDELTISEKIIETQSKIETLINQEKHLQIELENIQKYKLVLTSSGKELENIVTQIFSELGFVIKETEYNRADGVFEYNNQQFVIEVKGVSKSAAEKHAAQLEKWVSDYIEKNDTIPKPILVVNGFRHKELSKRTEAVFPKQMIKYSEKRDHCLLTTTQLLCLFLDVKTNPQKKDELLQELFTTIGIYNKYKNPLDILS